MHAYIHMPTFSDHTGLKKRPNAMSKPLNLGSAGCWAGPWVCCVSMHACMYMNMYIKYSCPDHTVFMPWVCCVSMHACMYVNMYRAFMRRSPLGMWDVRGACDCNMYGCCVCVYMRNGHRYTYTHTRTYTVHILYMYVCIFWSVSKQCAYAYIHTYIHTYIYIYIYIYTRTSSGSYTHVRRLCIHAFMYVCMYTNINTRLKTHT
jgi:hypothetical protein